MIRIIENGVAADMRKTEAKSDLQQTAHEEIKIFSTLLKDGKLPLNYQVSINFKGANQTCGLAQRFYLDPVH